MTFSTRSTPRLGQGQPALTSLGAVGGARGTAAGALRIFVEFLTSYDRGELDQLESDLANVDHAQDNSAKAEEKRQRRLNEVRTKLAEAESLVRGKLNTQLRSDLKKIEALETSRSKINRQRAATEREAFNLVARSAGLTKQEVELLSQRRDLRREEATLSARQAKADAGQVQRARQRQQIETQISKIETGRAQLLPKLSGLAIGAVGGIIGGAILGVGFSIAEEAISKIGEKIQDLIDPARHAREAIAELGAEVLQLARDQNITLFEAATQKAQELGVAQDQQAVSALANFAAQKKASDAAKEYGQFLIASSHGVSVQDQAIKELTASLIAEARAQGDAVIAQAQANGENVTSLEFLSKLPLQIRLVNGEVRQFINGEEASALATRIFSDLLQQNTAIINQNAQARERLATASALAQVQQDNLNDAISRQVDAQNARIDAQIQNLGTGESSRTRGLEARLEAAQGAGSGGSGVSQQLREIAEERQLLLLRQRLRLLGTAINLEKFSGKFLLEAINAKIAALQKESSEQQRLNQLLDLQFRMSQTIRRQQGESINEFVERRAQEQRHQLEEQEDLERQAVIDSLEAQKEKVEDAVALQELEERRKDALRQEGVRKNLKALQDQLAASRKADQEALESKRRALEAEKKAFADKAREAIRLSSIQANEEIRQAVRAANTISKLASLSGKTRGLLAAKAFLESLLFSGVLLPGEASDVKAAIQRISATLDAIGRQSEAVYSNVLAKAGQPPVPFAKGGVIELNNARNPFGSNVRFGEQGTELGVILSNRVTNLLRQQGGAAPDQVGPFYLQSSDNILKDRFAFKRLVKEAVSEALG